MNIELTQEQVAAFNRGESITLTPKPKPKQWEPRGGDYTSTHFSMLTIEAAKKASSAMRSYSRLLAYVDEFGGNWEADWEDNLELNYCVQYSNHSKKWGGDGRYMECVSGTVYMSEECAKGLVDKLKSFLEKLV